MQERIQKILSARGLCSRRKAEEFIERGLVKVNGIPAILGQKADAETDTIELDGALIEAKNELRYYLLNKPVGVVTTNAPMEGARTLLDVLPTDLLGKVFSVGRLDKETSGLLLLTNDGPLAFRLTHPRFDHEKEYEVTVEGELFDGALEKLRKGMMIDGEKTKPAVVRRLGPSSFAIAITEGRNRQIRRMCKKVGTPVITLRRTRIMTLIDDQLPAGRIRPLTPAEAQSLRASVGLSND